ncbi:MAG TPA: hypothetical protein ENH55_16635 [Aurantimonas coralicida]|uniref:Uncharacterized protein n=2 Tax=root TaxID=1 RepID=A0A9C9NEU8_9HYPH|nr:hypothetical protein [Aurantimonas coralicida]HEU00532.1 hypothetical protein [Aurantimonas coralicida]
MGEAKRDIENLDATRRLIVDRAAKLGKTLAELTRALPKRGGRHRNSKFIDDYIWKRSPWKLDEDDRPAIAAELGLEDWELLPVTGLGDRGADYERMPATAKPHLVEAVPVDLAELLGWLAEELQTLHQAERLPLETRELVTAAAQMHEEIGKVASEAEYHELAKRALRRRGLWLQRQRAAILTGRSQAGA